MVIITGWNRHDSDGGPESGWHVAMESYLMLLEGIITDPDKGGIDFGRQLSHGSKEQPGREK